VTDTTIATTEDMTEEEGARLIELEREVEKAMRSAGRIAGAALAEIRDQRLYRASHQSFGDYVLERHGLSRSTAYRMIETATGATDSNGLPPAAVAIGQASARAASRRHVTLDQPPATIDPRPEPLQEAPERHEEDEEERPAPAMPESRLIPPSPFPVTSGRRVSNGESDGRKPVRDGERDRARLAREGLSKVMAALNSALVNTTEAAMAGAATKTERIQIAKLGAAFTVEDRKANRPEGVVDPKDCDHPSNRIIGNQCGKCGAGRKAR
jgi:hypothetical protein